MKPLGSFVLALFAVAVVGGEEKKPAFDPAKLVGDWTYVSGVRGGEKVEQKHLAGKVAFTKDTITVPGSSPDEKFVMSYKIDTKATPAAIDMEIKEGPAKGGKAEGIIALEGGELKLCYIVHLGEDKAKRPTKFESTKENQAFYFVLKPAK
jgi:uncharacterized protein (TIGR03067 family)